MPEQTTNLEAAEAMLAQLHIAAAATLKLQDMNYPATLLYTLDKRYKRAGRQLNKCIRLLSYYIADHP